MKSILILILIFISGNLFAQKKEFKDTIFVTFNKKLDIKYGKSWHKEIDNSQEIKVWNKFSDSLKIKTDDEASNLNPLILKKKKVYDITDLLDKGVVEYLKIIESKNAFLVEKDNPKQLILFRIKNWIFSERPQE